MSDVAISVPDGFRDLAAPARDRRLALTARPGDEGRAVSASERDAYVDEPRFAKQRQLNV